MCLIIMCQTPCWFTNSIPTRTVCLGIEVTLRDSFLTKLIPSTQIIYFFIYFLYPLSEYKLHEVRDLFCLFTALFPEPVTLPGTQ